MLLELGASENDDATMREAEQLLPTLEKRVRDAELGRMLSGPADHANAIAASTLVRQFDAKDWAAMLQRMYMRYCQARGYKTEIIDFQESDDAGIDSVSFTVEGDHAFGYLRSENGATPRPHPPSTRTRRWQTASLPPWR